MDNNNEFNFENIFKVTISHTKEKLNTERQEFCNDLDILIDGIEKLYDIHWFCEKIPMEKIYELIKLLQQKYKTKIIEEK